MKPVSISSTSANGRRRAGFSLLEMLVGMGILSIIVLALFAMFNQTQKALLANVGQSDVMESGRSIMDLLGRDLTRARPSNLGSNIVYVPGTTQIDEVINPAANLVVMRTAAGPTDNNVRNVFLDQWRRDTLLHDVFYLSETEPGLWAGAGLFVAPEDPNNPDDGVGTLYRYEDRQPVNLRGARGAKRADLLYDRFFNNAQYRANPTNSSRLLDGVVFFRVTPFGPSGQALDRTSFSRTNLFPIPQGVLIGPDSRVGYPLNATLFRGQAFPSSLEVELGLLPTELLDRYRALPPSPPGIRSRFLTNNIANILVFRQRIPMATPSALP
ncbi:MAG: prepilin-type N-terminal cleavage/methylation domain-containing protein [Verrucomicrobia bacterium]|nr:prepilin-type N-terminal cleavage/methylation domain-containing protein [Verrucomicrobiota bacterium]